MSLAPATDDLALVAGSSGPEEAREDFCNSVRVAVRLDGTLEGFQLAEDSRNSHGHQQFNRGIPYRQVRPTKSRHGVACSLVHY